MDLKIPYRINWAGAYLDCIDEPVITSTIDKYITFHCTKRDDKQVVIFSKEFNDTYKTNLKPKAHKENKWTSYVDGCITVFTRNNFKLLSGCDIEVENDLPSGIGVSGSAAFIVGIIQCLCWANDIIMSYDLIAHFGYWVEHDYLNIPCGRMDFKAVLHEPGIWKIDTADISLVHDILLDHNHYTGLLLYKEQHEHLADEEFASIVRDIKDTKNNFKNNLLSEYIDFEKNIVDCIVYESHENKLNEVLGIALRSSCLNMSVNLFKKQYEANKTEGVFGEKLVGSGLKGAKFLLINKAYEDKIIECFKQDYNVVEVNI